MTESAPRQLLRWLRSIDDDQFAAFLAKRPDLVSPLPVDMDQLAYRACTSSSLIRLLGRLNLRVEDIELGTSRLTVSVDGGDTEVEVSGPLAVVQSPRQPLSACLDR